MIYIPASTIKFETPIAKEILKQRSIEIQMTLNRLLPEARLSRDIEEQMRLLEF